MHYFHRVIKRAFLDYLSIFPITAIMGPRQSGKSTFLRHALTNYQYISFDDPSIVAQFQEDPNQFMTAYSNHVIFDEAQKVPEIFNYLKIAVDNDRQNYGKYVITGSSQFTLMEKISESLAGRIGLLSLLPFQSSEIPKELQENAIYKGSYPELIQNHYHHHLNWYAAYFDTYLNKDLRTMSHIGDLREFRRFVQLLAANTSSILNMNQYANDIGVSIPTIKRWVSILEASYVIFLLPPFYNNYGKRIVKRPKIYFYDTGLVAYLTGLETQSLYEKGPMAGALFENYVIAEILKKELHENTHHDFYYLRTSNGVEVDLIINHKQSQTWIEIKKNSTFNQKMLRGITSLMPDNGQGILLYTGETLPPKNAISVQHYREYLNS